MSISRVLCYELGDTPAFFSTGLSVFPWSTSSSWISSLGYEGWVEGQPTGGVMLTSSRFLGEGPIASVDKGKRDIEGVRKSQSRGEGK